MKKQLIHVFLGLILIVSSAANTSAQDQELAHSMLWSVVFPKIPADTSYIFGTIDVISQKDFILKDKVYSALSKSTDFYTEQNILDPKVQEEMKAGMKLPEDETLEKLLKKKDYALLNSFLLEGSGESLKDFNDIKPYFVKDALLKYYINGNPASYTKLLLQIAQSSQIKVHSLERVNMLMTRIDSISYKEQVKDLLKMVDDVDETRANYKALTEAYTNENLNKVDSLIRLMMPSERTRKIMIDNRTIRMLFLVINHIRENHNFIAMNASHLAGKNGLISLLRQAGYNVEPVYDQPEAR